ncbi:MAG: hypothetical protein A2373_01325 [Candidatus Magasanikbacteria bacterium RIFOXYB1_FULL_40_15]|uniref:Peptidase S1 domain-containing protein n=2 Tax=Candidatus Magasanikiibacteriota TaxID=1752731 RepID=A0A1F6NK25_9BACT|nr:MAG: hypothetical protein A2373_01325 [Candidatus Magasanikbacteria bacterium RIFOXYB1_FULL_40_15]
MKRFNIFLLFVFTWLLMLSFFFYLELKEAINFNYLNFYYNETEVQKAYAATAEIAVFKNGDMYGCTAFAYKRTGNEYSFITAAHCVSTTDDEKHEIIMNAEIVLLKLHDEVNVDDVHYYFGIVDAVGYETVGHDFAILSAKIYDREIPVFTLADYPLEKNQCVFNVSYPAEADGNVFFGSVTETDEDYILSKLFGIQVASGASGSALVGCTSGKVHGIVYAWRENTKELISIPIDRFKMFEEKVRNHKYLFPVRGMGEDNICEIDEESY